MVSVVHPRIYSCLCFVCKPSTLQPNVFKHKCYVGCTLENENEINRILSP